MGGFGAVEPARVSRPARNRANASRKNSPHPRSGSAAIQSTASVWTGCTANSAAATKASAIFRVSSQNIAKAASAPPIANNTLVA